MTVSVGIFSALILAALLLVTAAPVILLALWVIDWIRGSLW